MHPSPKQEHARVFMILRVLMVCAFSFVPLVPVVLVGPGGPTWFFGGGLQALFSGGLEARNLVRVLTLAEIITTCSYYDCVGVGGQRVMVSQEFPSFGERGGGVRVVW